MLNRDALRSTAHNGCVQPVRGQYGAIRYTPRPRRFSWAWSLLALLLVCGGTAAYLLLTGTLTL